MYRLFGVSIESLCIYWGLQLYTLFFVHFVLDSLVLGTGLSWTLKTAAGMPCIMMHI